MNNTKTKYSRCINIHNRQCFICGHKGKLEFHHICRTPEVTIMLCKICHRKVDDTNLYPHLKPVETTREHKFVEWAYHNRDKLHTLYIKLINIKDYNGKYIGARGAIGKIIYNKDTKISYYSKINEFQPSNTKTNSIPIKITYGSVRGFK